MDLSKNLHRSPYPPSSSTSTYFRGMVARAMHGTLDRVNVLGDDRGYGHTGCVNALSWAHDNSLISGGDDKTVIIWRVDPDSDTSTETTQFPFKATSTIRTGHTANIFNVQLLPHSSTLATVAGDGQVRVFDAERPLASREYGHGIEFTTRETCKRVFTCHSAPTKRITTEDSPDLFLTVSEDGTVRQHDLRNAHSCRQKKKCPAPLVSLQHELSTLALSPLSPHLFVVAGESRFGYLFDRRQVGRILREEWGVPSSEETLTTCVRRFGRKGPSNAVRGGYEHITGARMARTNGHEVLLSYSNDGVYLYSIYDDVDEDDAAVTGVVPPNRKRKRTVGDVEDLFLEDAAGETDDSRDFSESSEEEETSGSDLSDSSLQQDFSKVPTILPRQRYSGHCNIETVKDVNFIGAEDEFVASGSDDGNFFLWQKDSGKLHGIYEGDGSVVNVIEQHPCLPLLACSGIDTTIKLFAPTSKASQFSRMGKSTQIIDSNGSRSRRSYFEIAGLSRLVWQYRMALAGDESDSEDDDN